MQIVKLGEIPCSQKQTRKRQYTEEYNTSSSCATNYSLPLLTAMSNSQ